MNKEKLPSKSMRFHCRTGLAGLLIGLLNIFSYSDVFASAGNGGIVQGVVSYPDFLSTPGGSISDMESPGGDSFPPYTDILSSPFSSVDDGVHTPGIPNISVYLKNMVTNAVTAPITTDSNGVFVFPSKPAGDWALCWLALPGMGPGCSDTSPLAASFTLLNHASNRWVSNLGSSNIIDWTGLDNPANNNLAFEGYVQAPGLPAPYQPNLNRPCYHFDPFFGNDQTATVQLLDSSQTVIAQTRANRLGRYLIAVRAPATPSSYTLKATCGTFGSASVNNIPASGAGRFLYNIALPFNAPPVITSVFAKSGSVTVVGVPLGSTVVATVSATDSDANTVTYGWRATAGKVTPHGNTADWVLPATGKGLHFLYVKANDGYGGHDTKRIAISTDAGIVAAPAPSIPGPKQPADFYPEDNRFLTYRGVDTKISACQYYKAIGAVTQCSTTGDLVGGITFDLWLAKFGLSKPPSPYTATPTLNPGEFHAQFRNVADLNLIRNHRGRNAGPDVNGKDKVAYYVCNHAKATGAIPDTNLVACVSMEYSVTPGQNGGKPFTKFLTFGPTGNLIASVNLDGRGEKFTPGNCVPCHGGDNYFYHFPEKGAGALDGNIGAYFIPFDLDNFQFQTPYTRSAQETAVRNLNRGLLVGEMLTSAAKELINGWYPTGTALAQKVNFLPKGWDATKTPSVPVVGQIDPDGVPYRFNGRDLYLKVIKPSCRGCHLAMGAPLGLDFHSYDFDGTPGDFVGGHAIIPRTQINALHTSLTVCNKYADGLPTYNSFEDLNSPARTMPNAIQTFNRFWKDPVQISLMETYLTALGENAQCIAPGL